MVLEQEALIAKMYKETFEKDRLFKIAFTGIMLFPTPLYIVLPYCTQNPVLSLLSLVSTVLSAYVLNYPTPSQDKLKIAGLSFAVVILLAGYIEHRPWKGYDYIWGFPLVSAITAITVMKWMDDARAHINDLVKAKYPLSGA